MKSSAHVFVLMLGAWLAFAPPAHANIIWPALFVAPRLLSVPAVVCGLAVEIIALRVLFKRPWLGTVASAVVANAVSVVE
jgi:hypothetical protein